MSLYKYISWSYIIPVHKDWPELVSIFVSRYGFGMGGFMMLVKILVVDDSAADRLIIREMLSDYDVLTACNGSEAMSILEEHTGIDLILLNLKMPDMDGFRILEALKDDKRFDRLRTIILTDCNEPENEIKGLELGAVDYIRKPINMYSLRARIDVHVELLRVEHELKQRLDESERSKSVLLSHLPGLAYRCSFDRDWTMQFVSKGCLDLTGYPPESLLYNRDLSFNDIIAPEYRESLWNEWVRVLEERKTFNYEYEIVTADGERKWVIEIGQGIFNDDGAVEALEGIVLDISDRKAIEKALIYNNEHDRLTGLYNRDYLMSVLEKDAVLKRDSMKALVCVNLSMIQLLAANYGFRYARDLIKTTAEILGKLCTEDRPVQDPGEYFCFYLRDYEDKSELVDFGGVIANALGTLLLTERIGGGIGILEIGLASSIWICCSAEC